MNAEEFLRSKGYDAGEEPSEGIKDLLDEFGELSIKKSLGIKDFDVGKMKDVDLVHFLIWYKNNKEIFYSNEYAEQIVEEYRRQNRKID